MKKLLALILSLSLCGAFFVGCTNDDTGSSSSSSSSSSNPFGDVSTPEEEETEEVKYTITYYAVFDGGLPLPTIPEGMKAQNGQYPVEYVYGEGAVVSDLLDTTTYDFQGWYTNAACTTAFTSPISATSAANQTLYAKIATILQEPVTPETKTITYYAVINDGEPVEIPEVLKMNGGNYPTEYTVGVGVTTAISALNDIFEYDFEGWYINAACDNTFVGTIDTNANGAVTLYAKISTKATIIYRAVVDGELKEFKNMDDFKVKDKVYPTEYAYNATTTVDNLKNYGNYEFGGWYLDEDCETEFSGTIDATNTSQRGTITLYAKITDLNNNIYWTPNY